MAIWRIRRCTDCGWVGPAGELRFVGQYGAYWGQQGDGLRECPRCGRRAETRDFPAVARKPAKAANIIEREEKKHVRG